MLLIQLLRINISQCSSLTFSSFMILHSQTSISCLGLGNEMGQTSCLIHRLCGWHQIWRWMQKVIVTIIFFQFRAGQIKKHKRFVEDTIKIYSQQHVFFYVIFRAILSTTLRRRLEQYMILRYRSVVRIFFASDLQNRFSFSSNMCFSFFLQSKSPATNLRKMPPPATVWQMKWRWTLHFKQSQSIKFQSNTEQNLNLL